MLDDARGLFAQLSGSLLLGIQAKSILEHHEHGQLILRDAIVVRRQVASPLMVTRRPLLSHYALY